MTLKFLCVLLVLGAVSASAGHMLSEEVRHEARKFLQSFAPAPKAELPARIEHCARTIKETDVPRDLVNTVLEQCLEEE